jgi:hypothetical protein
MSGALSAAARSFVARYSGSPKLVAEQAGWTLTIALTTTDTVESVAVRVADGHVVEVGSGRSDAALEVLADAATLIDVLELRRSANEAYLFGELVVRGREADFVRLDYVASALCLR